MSFSTFTSSSTSLFAATFKVIPQKLNLPMNFFQTFPESSLLSTVSKKTIKMIGHLRDMMGQSYPIYACTSANCLNNKMLKSDWFLKALIYGLIWLLQHHNCPI